MILNVAERMRELADSLTPRDFSGVDRLDKCAKVRGLLLNLADAFEAQDAKQRAEIAWLQQMTIEFARSRQ